MIHYNTKATFENFEKTNKSKVDCEMIQKKKKNTHIHTQRNKKIKQKQKAKTFDENNISKFNYTNHSKKLHLYMFQLRKKMSSNVNP